MIQKKYRPILSFSAAALIFLTACKNNTATITGTGERIDLFTSSAVTGPSLQTADRHSIISPDSAFRKSELTVTAEVSLADSMQKGTRNNAGSYLYHAHNITVLKNMRNTPLKDLFFVSPQKINAKDAGRRLLFLCPLNEHSLLEKNGSAIRWQWVRAAPVLLPDTILLSHWESIHYLAAPAPRHRQRSRKIRY
ncbi:hypothetical protein ACTHGU_09040 [Chitinophagaceae bacterium MMS25-I14]